MLNFRSKGESNETVKQELKEAKLRKSLLSESSSVATLTTKKTVIKNEKIKQENKQQFQNSLLPSLMKDKLYIDVDNNDNNGSNSRPLSSNQLLTSSSQSKRSESMSITGSVDGSLAGMSSLGSVSNLSDIIGTGDSIDSILEEYYHEGLVKLLNKYTNQNRETAEIDGHETATVLESSIDLGLVTIGTKIKITLLLKSLASDKLSIDITCRNFPDDTRLLTHSSGIDTKSRFSKNSIIPGFNRHCTIDFVIVDSISTLCFIDISINPIYRGPGHTYNDSHFISLPVLYRVKTRY